MKSDETKSKRRWVLYPIPATNGMAARPSGFASSAVAIRDARAEDVATAVG